VGLEEVGVDRALEPPDPPQGACGLCQHYSPFGVIYASLFVSLANPTPQRALFRRHNTEYRRRRGLDGYHWANTERARYHRLQLRPLAEATRPRHISVDR
jgi:hypothetical protein